MHTQAGRHNSKGRIPVNIEEITKAFGIGSVNAMNVLTAGHINLSIKITAGTGVFMVEGLQLIVAVLLMILGVTIVITSGKELIKAKKA